MHATLDGKVVLRDANTGTIAADIVSQDLAKVWFSHNHQVTP